MSKLDYENVKEQIVSFIKEQVEESGCKGVVIGLSGGLDSAVVTKLCILACGKDKVYTLTMPTSQNKHSIDAEDLAIIFKTKNSVIEISPILDIFSRASSENVYLNIQMRKNRLVAGNTAARVRMILLYQLANSHNLLVAGTGNKSELMTGYFTKHGDGGCDMLPIGDLYKTEVKKLAKILGVPKSIIDKAPTAGLWENQTDEEELGITYKKLDIFLRVFNYYKGNTWLSMSHNLKNNDEIKILKLSDETIDKLLIRIRNSRHKLIMPRTCYIY